MIILSEKVKEISITKNSWTYGNPGIEQVALNIFLDLSEIHVGFDQS